MHQNYRVRVLNLRLNKPNTWVRLDINCLFFSQKKHHMSSLWLVGTFVKYDMELNLDQDVPNQA